ncbi:MAG: GDSL-type esterase/lipase family protein [Bacteroidota bacterium]|nr:GDSL-type esterase/lipase family protein [Bacteroidota bacterium]
MLWSFSFAQERPRTQHWQARNQLFETELDSISEGKLVFLGNSITEGFDLELYFPQHQTYNRGIVGDHLDGLIERLNNSAVALKPEKLFLMVGINDIGDQRSDEYLKLMFTTLVDTLISELPETQIYLHSILPTSARWKNCPPDQIKRLNSFLTLMTIEKGLVFVNLYPCFLDDTQYLNPELTRDGLHPNKAGYDIWAEKIRSFLD